MRINRKYGNCMADGGVVKKKPMKKPETGGKPNLITTPGKPGDSGPGGAHPGRNRKKMADGGKVYGAPMSTPKPGGTTRKRPKVGDKSDDTRLLNPRKPPSSSKPESKPASPATVRRDYRGTKGAIEDAGG
jgi:hypothetical protein